MFLNNYKRKKTRTIPPNIIMEMEKPKATQQTSSVSPALASSAPQLSSVEDLERRLKLIGNAPSAETVTPYTKPAAAAAPPASTSGMTGKAALLVRFFGLLFVPSGCSKANHRLANVFSLLFIRLGFKLPRPSLPTPRSSVNKSQPPLWSRLHHHPPNLIYSVALMSPAVRVTHRLTTIPTFCPLPHRPWRLRRLCPNDFHRPCLIP